MPMKQSCSDEAWTSVKLQVGDLASRQIECIQSIERWMVLQEGVIQSASHLETAEVIRSVAAVESPGYAVDVEIPQALHGRWTKINAINPSTRACGASSVRSSGPASRSYSANLGGAPKLHARWKDVYVATVADSDAIPNSRAAKNAGRSSLLSLRPGKNCSVLISPHDPARIMWDIVGLMLIIFDVVWIPIAVSWEISLKRDSPLQSSIFCMIAYWTVDSILAFQTGYYDQGTLVLDFKQVCRNHMRTWLTFDLTILSLDALLLFSDEVSTFRVFRAIRVIRVLRMARLLKFNKCFRILEECLTGKGQNSIILAAAVVKILFSIVLVAHLGACLWFFIGFVSWETGSASWLDAVDGFQGVPIVEQYMRSLHYSLGHLTAAPVDGSIVPQNLTERTVTVIYIVCSMLVLGGALSKMASTIEDLSKMNSELTQTRQSLRAYLKAFEASAELSGRILRFGMYTVRRKKQMVLAPEIRALLSESLANELTLSQRRRYLLIHPLFMQIDVGAAHWRGSMLLDICNNLTPHCYADGEIVFQAGLWADCMYVTAHGKYKLHLGLGRPSDIDKGSMTSVISSQSFTSFVGGGESSMENTFQCLHWFSEVALFARVVHQSTLTATTFADAFTLTGENLVSCVLHSPQTIAFIYAYANAFLSSLWDGSVAPDDKVQVDDYLHPDLSSAACLFGGSTTFVPGREGPTMDPEQAAGTIAKLFKGEMSAIEAKETLPHFFDELHPDLGPYAKLSQLDEAKRAMASILSVYLLHTNQYSLFSARQPSDDQMSLPLWSELREFVVWVGMDAETMHAVMVYQAIRGLGKCKEFAVHLPKEDRGPEQIVRHLIVALPDAVPSVSRLSDCMVDVIDKVLKTTATFNLAQMLQGENIPHSVKSLQTCMQNESDDVLKFYLLALVGMMSGILGTVTLEGSLIMAQEFASNLMLGVQRLRGLASASPHAIYWSFIHTRGLELGLPGITPEDVALSRLACLTRARPSDVFPLQEAWQKLTAHERMALTEHLLADGIQDKAMIVSFLPLYFANSYTNEAIGLYRALVVFIELLAVLMAEGCLDRDETRVVVVSIMDVATFLGRVKSPRIFAACPEQIHINEVGAMIILSITPQHWHRVDQTTWADDPLPEIGHVVKQTARRMGVLEATLCAGQFLSLPGKQFIRCSPGNATDFHL